MKNLIILVLLIISISVSGQNNFKYIINANGGIKASTPITVLDVVKVGSPTTDTLATQAYARLHGGGTVPTQINDSIAARLAAATVGVALADSNVYDGGYATPAWVAANAGSGTSLTGKRLQFIADVTTGAPEAGDTILIHSNFINKHVDIYRDGAKQYKNFTATNTVEGYRIRSGSDTIYVNPAFQANEQIIVDMIEPINWEFISVKGQDLLDGLVAYYKFDETSGTSLTDEIGGNTATLDGDINQTGIINQAVGLTANNDDIVIPYKEGVSLGQSDIFSLSMWIYAEDIPSVVGRTFTLYQQNNSIAPYNPHAITLQSSDDKIYFGVKNTSETSYSVKSSGVISADTWYHLVVICPGDGEELQMWLNGSDVSASAWTFSGSLYEADSYGCLGNAYSAATNAFYGKIDEFAHYNKALTEAEILKLYNAGSGNQHPFE